MRRGLIGLCLLAMTTAGCATNAHPAAPTVQPAVERSLPVMIQSRPLDLHLLVPRGSPAANVLVLYASGDGGWFGAAVGMFRRIGEKGYYTAGFNARAFMKIDRPAQAALNPEQVATEYGQIAEAARGGLHLPSTTPVVLTGWSRGASLSVLAAAARGTPRNVAGVIAIGLAEGEDLEYALLGSLRVPCAVIQATRDNDLSAARARALFGADTAARRFYAVEARNHRFSGGKEAFDRALTNALAWVVPPGGSTSDTVMLRGHAQTVHLYGRRGAPPVIVSSGDGGWMHLGPEVAELLAARGYFVVGFDVKAYLASFTSGVATLRPEDEPADYKVLAEYASRGTSQKPILIGVSEGAGLSVLAATDPDTKGLIAGVIALGLPNVNELGWRWRDSVIYLTHGVPHEPTFSAAALIERVSPAPLAAIQSTRDEFVPLPEARRVLDAAKDPKRLWVVKASDHRFSDNRPEFEARLLEAIAWVQANRTGSRS